MKIKIASYNIQHCRDHIYFKENGTERLVLPEMANVIKAMKADVCALNEVYNQEMLEGGINQAKEIGKELGFYHAFAKAIDYKGYEYGNALVSRFPIVSTKLVPLVLSEEKKKKPRYENRVLLIAELDVNGSPLTVFVCHFGLSPEEAELATETVLVEAEKIKTPLVFMGDLNLTPDSELIKKISACLFDAAQLSDADNFTFSSDAPFEKIDYIFTNGHCKATSFEVPNLVCSDHLPVRADIEI